MFSSRHLPRLLTHVLLFSYPHHLNLPVNMFCYSPHFFPSLSSSSPHSYALLLPIFFFSPSSSPYPCSVIPCISCHCYLISQSTCSAIVHMFSHVNLLSSPHSNILLLPMFSSRHPHLLSPMFYFSHVFLPSFSLSLHSGMFSYSIHVSLPSSS